MGLKDFVDKKESFDAKIEKINKYYEEICTTETKYYGYHGDAGDTHSDMWSMIKKLKMETSVSKGDYTYEYDEKEGGMRVYVTDKSKKEYGPIETEINGISVVSLEHTFSGCKNMLIAPEIPPTVRNVNKAFYNCEKLTTKPEIPEHVVKQEDVFRGCYNLGRAPEIPIDVQLGKKTKVDFNLIAAYVIRHEGISQKELMDKFGMSRFGANSMLSKLQKRHIVSHHFPSMTQISYDRCRPVVPLRECEYLGINIDKFDFSKDFVDATRDKIIADKGVEVAPGMEKLSYQLIPVDGNLARMQCGDLKTGDIVVQVVGNETGINRNGDSVGFNVGYEYRYNQSATMKVTGHTYDMHQYGWKTNTEQQGWGVRAIGLPVMVDTVRKDGQHPAKFMPTINAAPLGKPVVNMDYTYADFENLKEVKLIPDTVKSIQGICMGTALEKTPHIPESVERATSAFSQCGKLSVIENVPTSVKEADNMFYACGFLEKAELDKIPDTLDASKVARFCGEKCVSDNGVLDGNNVSQDEPDAHETKTNSKDTPNHNTDDIDI